MFDPEDKTAILSKYAKPNFSYSPIVISMPEKDRLRWYLINCSGTRKYFGFAMTKEKKLIVEDVSKLNRLDAETKAILRELYLELK